MDKRTSLVIPEEFARTLTDDEAEKVKADFSGFDLDGSGAISQDELKQVFARAGVTLTPSQFKELFAEVDLDGSGTLSFSEYVMMIVRAKQGKRGSGMNLVFSKAADMLRVQGSGGATHSFSIEERNAFCVHINQILSEDESCKRYLPLRPESQDLFERTSDGVIYCKLINLAIADTVDERTINNKDKLNKYQIIENLNLALNAAKAIGCRVVNVGAFDLIDGNPILVLGLLWQIIKIQLTSTISLKEHPELVLLFEEGEDMAAFMKLPVETILLRWVNFHLREAGSSRRVTNFGKDVEDSEAYGVLLNRLDPSKCPLLPNSNPLDRAGKAIASSRAIGVEPFIQPLDICAGNRKLNLGFAAQIFNTNPGLFMTEAQAAELDMSMLEIDDVGDSREERVFRMWINSLDIRDLYLNDLFIGLDAYNLLRLLSFCFVDCVNFRKVNIPKEGANLGRFKQVENGNMAVVVGKEAGLSLVNIGGLDIVDRNKKLILAIVWQLMHAYTLQTLQDLAIANGIPGKVSEKDVIKWANQKVAAGGRACTPIKDFRDKSLASGTFLITLIAAIEARAVQWELATPGSTPEDQLSNCKYVISLARKVGACVFVCPEDIQEVKQKMLFTFVAALWGTDMEKSAIEAGGDASVVSNPRSRAGRCASLEDAIASASTPAKRRVSSSGLPAGGVAQSPSVGSVSGAPTHMPPPVPKSFAPFDEPSSPPPKVPVPSGPASVFGGSLKSPGPSAAAQAATRRFSGGASPAASAAASAAAAAAAARASPTVKGTVADSAANSGSGFITDMRSRLKKTTVPAAVRSPGQEASGGGRDIHPSAGYKGDGTEVDESEWS